MPHIHTEPDQHDHTVSAFIIRTDDTEPRVLLHKHKKLGVYMQFGGHVELDETPWHAMKHELSEETGYTLDQLQLLQQPDRIKSLTAVLHPQPVVVNTHPLGPRHFHTDSTYAFVTTEEPTMPVGAGESTDFLLLTRAELLKLSEDQMFPDVKTICLYIFDICLTKWERIDCTSFYT